MSNPIFDEEFLLKLDEENQKEKYVRLTALTLDELPIEYIEGKSTGGSINVDGNSSVRRTCSLTMIADKVDIHDYNWTFKRKIMVEVGLKNTIDDRYPDIIWFKQGIFVINTFSCQLATNNYSISLSAKDKMCLVNGECGGSLPTSVDFGKKDFYDPAAQGTVTKEVLLKDIIREGLHTFCNESWNNIIINDLDEEGLNLLEYRGTDPMYFFKQVGTEVFENATRDGSKIVYFNGGNTTLNELNEEQLDKLNPLVRPSNPLEIWFNTDPNKKYTVAKINYGETAGYEITDLTYAGDLIANVGESFGSVLDKIVSMLGDFEYFYNIDGKFVFQKKKNYAHTTFTPIEQRGDEKFVDPEAKRVIYDFNGNKLISNLSNSPTLSNLKNDYSVWGARKGVSGANIPVHMRFAIDDKPKKYTTIEVTAADVEKYKDLYPIQPQESVTYIDSEVDWREILYQMARDWYQYSHIDEFELKVAAANTTLYPTGKTGYEQYYTDIFGFWRDLYNPSPEVLTEPKKDVYSYYQWDNNAYTEKSLTEVAELKPFKRNKYYVKQDNADGSINFPFAEEINPGMTEFNKTEDYYTRNAYDLSYSKITEFHARPSGASFKNGIWTQGGNIETTAIIDNIYGNTLVLNQLLPIAGKSTVTDNGITFTNNHDGSYTVNGTATDTSKGGQLMIEQTNTVKAPIDHKILCYGLSLSNNCSLRGYDINWGIPLLATDNGIKQVGKRQEDEGKPKTAINWWAIYAKPGITYENVKIRPICIDLTLMFGEGNEPETIEEFISKFKLQYYEYNLGSFVNYTANNLKMSNIKQFNLTDYMSKIGIAKTGDYYVATARIFLDKSNQTPFIFPQIANQRYIIKMTGHCETTKLTVFYLLIYYTDETYDALNINSTSETTVQIITKAGKTVNHIQFYYGNGGNVNFYLKDVQCLLYKDSMLTTIDYWENELNCHVLDYFPNGMKSVLLGGEEQNIVIYDELNKNTAIKRIGQYEVQEKDISAPTTYTFENGEKWYSCRVLLPTVYNSYSLPGTYGGFGVLAEGNWTTVHSAEWPKVKTETDPRENIPSKDHIVFGWGRISSQYNGVWFVTKSITTLEGFKNELIGKTIYYVLNEKPTENPDPTVIYQEITPISPALNLSYPVSKNGAEQIISTNLSSPARFDIIYPDNEYFPFNQWKYKANAPTYYKTPDYDLREGDYKYFVYNVRQNPELLNFWIDFLDPDGELADYSVPAIGPRLKATTDNNVKAVCYQQIPNVIFVKEVPTEQKTGYCYVQVNDSVYSLFSLSAQGKSAKDVVDDYLYTLTYCQDKISLTTIPIYYLEPNRRIRVQDKETGINGEFILNQFSIPLTYNGTMSITASQAVEYYN